MEGHWIWGREEAVWEVERGEGKEAAVGMYCIREEYLKRKKMVKMKKMSFTITELFLFS